MADIYRVSREKLASLIRLGIERGELRALPPESVAAALTGVADAFVLQAVVDPAFRWQEHLEAVWTLLRDGIVKPAK